MRFSQERREFHLNKSGSESHLRGLTEGDALLPHGENIFQTADFIVITIPKAVAKFQRGQ